MDTRILSAVICTLLISFSAAFSTGAHRYHTHLENIVVLRNQSSSHRSRYPQYMMQLYHSFKMADSISSPAVTTFTSQREKTSAHSFDSVLSLVAKGCYHIGDRWTVTFDMSSVSTSELIQRAELQIRLPAFSAAKHTTVDLYHSPKQSCGPSCRDEVFLGSLDSKLSSTKSSWQVFDVTVLLKFWLYQADKAMSYQASGDFGTESESGSGEEGNPSLSSFEMRRRKTPHPTANRVMMVIFSKQNFHHEGHASYSLIQTVENSKYVTKSLVTRDNQARRHKRNRMERLPVADRDVPTVAPAEDLVQRPLCQKVDMWVDFDYIGWDEWIVHPKRYNAYRCEGECPTPLDESLHPTNHAFMQSLLRHHHPDRVSCSSCVPTRLSPLSMLYYENEDLTLRHHEEMIVEECGCH